MTYIDVAVARVVELEQEALAGSQAYPMAVYKQDTYPYWTNQVANVTWQSVNTDDRKLAFEIQMRLHKGKLTEGAPGTIEAEIFDAIEAVLEFFDSHRMLVTATQAAPPNNLNPLGTTCGSSTGITSFNGDTEIGTRFTLAVAFKYRIARVF